MQTQRASRPIIDTHFDEDADIRRACHEGDFHRGATLLLQRFGPQLERFILGRVGVADWAAEVYSDLCLDVWRGLPGFGWRCPVRAWAYTLARNAANRYVTAPSRRPARNIPLSEVKTDEPCVDPRVDEPPAPAYLCPEIKRHMRQLRAQLSREEQQLIALRVDRGMRWRDLTLAMEGDIDDPAQLERVTARMRKRFQLIKDKLRGAAIRDGVVAA